MTIANVSQGNACGLPQALRTAQEAIHLNTDSASSYRTCMTNKLVNSSLRESAFLRHGACAPVRRVM